ncbi:hypothetical protein BJ875DRAFT_481896 [Amylocarpus encephaloides]|uniref:Uncharacterized protein n=1 Tax=Amylocarpus encephaloides TaxID=45428 RepID=A0A9P7YNK5_9HELO|nr:hypothetical protein BJ875DRAFT_481896 [Amylocarpus encephaloides]
MAFSTLESISSSALVQANWAFGPKICQAGGFGYNYIRISNSTTNAMEKVYKFTTIISIPNMSSAERANFTASLVKTMNDLGITHSNLVPGVDHGLWPVSSRPGSTGFGQTRQESRLIRRANFENGVLLGKTSKAIQMSVVEDGYTSHAIHHQPSLSALLKDFVPNAVHESYRTTGMYA